MIQETRPAAALSATPTTPSTTPLKVGTLLSETGGLVFLGPTRVRGGRRSDQEINAVGEVQGNLAVNIRGDSDDHKADTASQTVDRGLSQGVRTVLAAR